MRGWGLRVCVREGSVGWLVCGEGRWCGVGGVCGEGR